MSLTLKAEEMKPLLKYDYLLSRSTQDVPDQGKIIQSNQGVRNALRASEQCHFKVVIHHGRHVR